MARARGRGSVKVAENITISAQQHQDLVDHINKRLEIGDGLRQTELERYANIDRELYGYLVLDEDDRKRARDNRRGHGVKPVDVKLPLVWAQLDEAVTFLMMVLAPDEAMYNAQAPRGHQQVAKAFAALMNKHAEKFGHTRHLLRFLFDTLRYNIGGYEVEWRNIIGNQLTNNKATGRVEVTRGTVATGNALSAFDMYNTLYDPSVDPVDLPQQGEFYATVKMTSKFRWQKMEADGEIFGTDRFVDTEGGQAHFYEMKPEIRADANLPKGTTDWISIFSIGQQSERAQRGFEQVNFTSWVRPRDFGLSNSTDLEIWRFTTGHKHSVVSAVHLNNAHGMLPCNMARPIEDNFNWATKSYAEHLIPYNQFSSFTMNTHQRAVRKRLYGLTIYDKRVIPLLESTTDELAGGKIPAQSNGEDIDLRKKIVQFTDGPDTSRTLEDIERMDGLMQKIMPTDILKQVATLERATQYQAAATVQGANRRNLKIAKMINTQAMDNGRHMQMYNILQFQENATITGPDGEDVEVNPTEFREAGLEFVISDGLKGLDRLSLVMNIKEVLNAILQSQQAAAQFDVVQIINYWTSLLGDHTDFTQFRVGSPLDNLPAQERNAAFQLYQQAVAAQEGQAAGGGGNGAGAGTPVQ